MSLHTKFNKLPQWDEFKTLFSEYKISSIRHRLVPYYKNNLPFTTDSIATSGAAIPNFEIYMFPVNMAVRTEDLVAMTQPEFNDFANISQRKSVRIMPSGNQTWLTKKPMVVGYKGPVDKAGGISSMIMERPSWFSTDETPIAAGSPNQTDIAHCK